MILFTDTKPPPEDPKDGAEGGGRTSALEMGRREPSRRVRFEDDPLDGIGHASMMHSVFVGDYMLQGCGAPV